MLTLDVGCGNKCRRDVGCDTEVSCKDINVVAM